MAVCEWGCFPLLADCACSMCVCCPAVLCTGVDLDYEPTNSNCVVRTSGVTCNTDAESVSVTTGAQAGCDSLPLCQPRMRQPSAQTPEHFLTCRLASLLLPPTCAANLQPFATPCPRDSTCCQLHPGTWAATVRALLRQHSLAPSTQVRWPSCSQPQQHLVVLHIALQQHADPNKHLTNKSLLHLLFSLSTPHVQPTHIHAGVNLAMAASPAGQSLDLINIMAYDAGNTASTGDDEAVGRTRWLGCQKIGHSSPLSRRDC